MKQTDVDLLLARAQVGLATLFAVLIFALIFVLIFWHASISPTALTVITSVITALVTVLTLQQNFFFARTRPAALPDPTTTTTQTTTTTTPTPPAPVIVPAGSVIAPHGVPNAPTSTAAQVSAALGAKPPI